MSFSITDSLSAKHVPRFEIEADETRKAAGGFGEFLEQAIDRVDAQQTSADNRISAFIRGESVPIHDLMGELSRAELSMQLMTAVVNKAIGAYNEISRMQI